MLRELGNARSAKEGNYRLNLKACIALVILSSRCTLCIVGMYGCLSMQQVAN